MNSNDAIPPIMTLNAHCTGPNRNCKKAAKNGQFVHMIPEWDASRETLIMPSYHFETEEIGRHAIETAYINAVTIKTDDELYDARKRGIAHKLPIGWIDPSRR